MAREHRSSDVSLLSSWPLSASLKLTLPSAVIVLTPRTLLLLICCWRAGLIVVGCCVLHASYTSGTIVLMTF